MSINSQEILSNRVDNQWINSLTNKKLIENKIPIFTEVKFFDSKNPNGTWTREKPLINCSLGLEMLIVPEFDVPYLNMLTGIQLKLINSDTNMNLSDSLNFHPYLLLGDGTSPKTPPIFDLKDIQPDFFQKMVQKQLPEYPTGDGTYNLELVKSGEQTTLQWVKKA